MASARLDVKEIFLQAVEIASPADRAAYLDQACGADGDRRRRVEALLMAHERPESLLDQAAINVQHPDVTIDHVPTERPGTVVAARYKLLEQIGEGGMGTVWIAEQTQPVRRKVALKLVKLGMDSRQVLSRFEAERQALALMDHPNIAKVFDGGLTEQGRPFFVMEYVKGVPLTAYCDNARLTVQERLKLFGQVCQAVQHAHQKGIIHRDLKPSNILVCLYDGQPVPKVIDFGLAKAIHQPLTEHTLHTAHGLMVGTPLYMSPEQAEFNNLDVDTRTDIYSLGVILYELLTGTTPLEKQQFKNAALAEILRLIKEEEPLKPSLKLSTSASLPSVAAQRSLEPAQLSRAVRGDLDWIVMKALEKERSRRYETANGLARDIDRYLCDEPVEACPPSAGYRLKKLFRRNKGPALAAAIVLLTLIGGIIGTTWGLIRAEKSRLAEAQQRKLAEAAEAIAHANEQQAAAERDRAEQEKRVAQAVKEFLLNGLLHQADGYYQGDALLQSGGTSADIKENPTIRELLDRAAAELTPDKIERQFPKLPLVQAEILKTIGDTYRMLGEYGPASAHLERARDLYISGRGSDHPDTLKTLSTLAFVYTAAGKFSEGARLYEQVRDKQIEELGPDHPDTLTTQHDLAWTYRDERKYPQAIQLFEHVRDRRIATLGPDHPDTLTALHNLAVAYMRAGKLVEALPLFEQVRDQRTAKLGPEHPDTLAALSTVAEIYSMTGKLSEAIQLFEQVRDKQIAKLGPSHRATLLTLNNFAVAYRRTGRLSEAIQLLEQVYEKNLTKFGPDYPNTWINMSNLAYTYIDAGRLPEAIQLFEQVRDKYIAKYGPDDRSTLSMLSGLASAYQRSARLPEAIRLYEQMVPSARRALGPAHSSTILYTSNWCNALDAARQFGKAAEIRRQLLEVQRQQFPANDPRLASALSSLGQSLLRAEQFTEAEPVFKECLAIREHALPDSYLIFSAKSLLGAALTGQKKLADAEPLLLAGYEGLKRREASIPESIRTRYFTEAPQRLIDLYTAWDKPDEAGKWRNILDERQTAEKPAVDTTEKP